MSDPPDLETLARRYLDLWQDQVTALAADPEFTQTVGRLLQVSATLGPAGWMSLWNAAAAGLKPKPQKEGAPAHGPASSKSEHAASRPASAAAPPDSGGDDVVELRRRVAALEAHVRNLADRAAPASTGREQGAIVDVARTAPVAEGSPRQSRRTAPRARRRRS